MRFLIFTTWTVLLIFQSAQAITPPDQSVIDNAVSLALIYDKKTLEGVGPVACQYDILVNVYGKDPEYIGRDKTIELAGGRLHAQCIKHRCGEVGLWIEKSLTVGDLTTSSDEELRIFLQSLGVDKEKTEALSYVLNGLKDRKTGAPLPIPEKQQLTCVNSALARQTVFDSCMTQPIICSGMTR